MTTPSVSVVIPTFNRRSSVVRALTALAAQDADGLEVVVAVDGSDDGTVEELASFAAPYELRVVEGPRRGRAAACNAALNVAGGEVVVVVDDDMEPERGWLVAHRRHHAAGTRLCVMGAAPIDPGPGAPGATQYMAWKFRLHLENLARPDHRFTLRDFYSGNTSIRRDVLLETGLYDESFTAYGNEDLELSLRLRAAGVELRYDPDAVARQHYEKDLAGLARDTFEKGTTAVLLAGTHPDAFGELQLAELRARGRLWRALRAALLRAPGLAGAVLTAARLLDRTPAGRRPMFYVLLLDYFYWLGARAALAEPPPTAQLADLASDLRHGPIRLLLHG